MKKYFLLFFLSLPTALWAQCGQYGVTTVMANIVPQAAQYFGVPFTISSSGQVGSLWIYDGSTGGASMVAGVYADNGSGTGPTTLIASSNATLIHSAGWQVCAMTTFPTLTSGTYWIVFQDGGDNPAYDNTGAATIVYSSVGYKSSWTSTMASDITGVGTLKGYHFSAMAAFCTSTYIPTPANSTWNKPPMSWNPGFVMPYGSAVSLLDVAQAMVTNGMYAAGYHIMQLDDGWFNGFSRSGGNTVVENVTQFPLGMQAFSTSLAAKGMTLGLYLDSGTETCLADASGSSGHEAADITYCISVGAKYLKLDSCTPAVDVANSVPAFTDANKENANPMYMAVMAPDYLFRVFFPSIAQSGRIISDLTDTYAAATSEIDEAANSSWAVKPGYYNDLQEMTVGKGGMTGTEDQREFSMWCMMNSPLCPAGIDPRSIPVSTLNVICNSNLIAIDQDPLCSQAVSVNNSDGGKVVVFSKTLSGTNRRVIAIDNRDTSTQNLSVTFSDMGLPAGKYGVIDQVSGTNLGIFQTTIPVTVVSHAATVLSLVTYSPSNGILRMMGVGN